MKQLWNMIKYTISSFVSGCGCAYAIYISLTGYVMYFYSCVLDCVLPAVGWNYTANIIGRTVTGQISTIYNDIGIVVGMDNCLCFKYTFQASSCLNRVPGSGTVSDVF